MKSSIALSNDEVAKILRDMASEYSGTIGTETNDIFLIMRRVKKKIASKINEYDLAREYVDSISHDDKLSIYYLSEELGVTKCLTEQIHSSNDYPRYLLSIAIELFGIDSFSYAVLNHIDNNLDEEGDTILV